MEYSLHSSSMHQALKATAFGVLRLLDIDDWLWTGLGGPFFGSALKMQRESLSVVLVGAFESFHGAAWGSPVRSGFG